MSGEKGRRDRTTTVTLRPVDQDAIDAIIADGLADNTTSAIRAALSLVRRWIDDGKRKAAG